VKAADKRKKWTESITNDITKAVSEAPLDCKVFAGSIILEFQMTREKADELSKQILDPTSWLLTKGKNRKAFQRAAMQTVEALGQRLSAVRFRDDVEDRIKTKSARPRVISVGQGDKGAVACLVADKKEAKWMKKQLDNVVRKLLEDVEFAEVIEHSEYMDVDFSVDIMEAGKGKDIVETLQNPESTTKIADLMAIYEGIDTKVSVVTPAASRKLAELEVVLKWSAKSAAVVDGLDCCCIVFAEEHFLHCASFSAPSASADASSTPQHKDNLHTEDLVKKVKRALRHAMPPAEHAQESHLVVDVSALPNEVTDLYFVMSTYETDDFSCFSNTSFSLIDTARDQELTSYSCNPENTQSAIVCNLSRHNSSWVVMAVGQPCKGNGHSGLDELLAPLSDFQGRHLNWERRRDLVKLRVLEQCGRMARSSGAEFAMLMQMIMELPVAVFQTLLKFI